MIDERTEKFQNIMMTWSLFYQIEFGKMKTKVYFCKVETRKHNRNEGKTANKGDASLPSNQ